MKTMHAITLLLSLSITPALAREISLAENESPKMVQKADEQSENARFVRPGIYLTVSDVLYWAFGNGFSMKFGKTLAVEAEVAHGKNEEESKSRSSNYNIKEKSILAVRGRYAPFSGTFNLSTGIAMEQINLRSHGVEPYKLSSTSSSFSDSKRPEFNHTAESRQLRTELAVGNHWAIADRIIIGCDWLGLKMTAHKFRETLNLSSQGAAPESEKEFKKLSDDEFNGPGVVLLRMRIGWQF